MDASQMVLEVPGLGTSPWTQMAGKRLLARVRAHMSGEFSRSHEGLAAHIASAIPPQLRQHAAYATDKPTTAQAAHATAHHHSSSRARQRGEHLRGGRQHRCNGGKLLWR